MSYTYVRREVTLEELAASVISSGHSFAESCAHGGPNPGGLRHGYLRMLSRFENGDVLDERDDRCLEAVGKALVEEIEKIVPGYANIILNEDTREDFFLNKDLEKLRRRLMQWQDFSAARSQLRSRIRARKLLDGV